MSTWLSLLNESAEQKTYEITNLLPETEYTVSINGAYNSPVEVWLTTLTVGEYGIIEKEVNQNNAVYVGVLENNKLKFTTQELHTALVIRTSGDLELTTIQLEKGTIVTDWTPAPEEQEQRMSIIEQTAGEIRLEVSELDGKVGSNTAQLSVQAGEISSKVSADDVASAINQTAEDIRLEVSESYVSNDDLGEYKNEVTGQITTEANRITAEVSERTNAINTLTGEIGDVLDYAESNIDILKNQIVLKSDTNGRLVLVKLDSSGDNGTLFTVSADNINLSGYVTISNLTTEINSTKSYADTKANTAQSNAKTYTDEQIVAIDGVLKTYTDSEISAFSGGLGDLAFKDKIGTALLDNTIIDGGYIKTNLISFNNAVGTNVNLTGTITATSGNIGGWAIGNGFLDHSSTGRRLRFSAIDTYSIYAGTDGSNWNFLLNKDGTLQAKNADISGKITATSGRIGELEITSTRLEYRPNPNNSVNRTYFSGRPEDTYVFASYDSNATLTFSIARTGGLYATNADISGKITATSGTFTGTVSGSSITGGSINIGSGNFTVNSSGVVVAKSITTTGTHSGTVNATGGYFTGGGTGQFSSGYHNNGSFSYGAFGGTLNSASGTLGGTSYSSIASGASFTGVVRAVSGFSTTSSSTLGTLLPATAGTSNLGLSSSRWGRLFSTYSTNVSSDIRLKENFKTIDNEFDDFIYSLPIGTYNLKEDKDKKPQIGINANFVDSLFPKEVTQYLVEQDEFGYYSAQYTNLVPMLVKVVQSQHHRLIDLEYEIKKMKGEL